MGSDCGDEGIVEGIPLKGRIAAPSHYLFQIQSFSLLSKESVKEYHSDEFEVGGFKWKLCICPTGDESRGGQDHISLYLELVEKSSFPAGWEVRVIFNLFIFNHLQDKYFSVQDGKVRRFRSMRSRWGIVKFMDLGTFCNPLNGYLINDTCVFGAEIFVIKSTFRGECLKLIRQPVAYIHNWEVDHFSSLLDRSYESDFLVGDYRWRIVLYPYGVSEAKGTNMSLFLTLDGITCPSDTKLLVKFMLSIKDHKGNKQAVYEAQNVFGPSTVTSWGPKKFISLAKLRDLKNGLLVDDTCIIEAEIKVLGKVESVDSTP